MLTIHHLRLSQSERIVWLAEELGLDYECKLYTRRSDNRLAPDEFKALHPMGIAPVITETDLFKEMTQEHIDSTKAKIPMGRFLTIDEIAAMVAWIAGPECTFCTGVAFDLSGGRGTY